MATKEGMLLISDSVTEADMFYATRFWVGDPFIHLRVGRKKIVVLSDLEIDRGRKALPGFQIVSLTELSAEARKASKNGRSEGASVGLAEAALALLRREKVKTVKVPGRFPLEFADVLRKRGIKVVPSGWPFFKARIAKREDEVEKLQEAQRITEGAMHTAIETIRSAEIRGEQLYLDGKPLTSEAVKELVGIELLKSGYAGEMIVAGGIQACDPHEVGHGPLPANRPIIVDIFPRSSRSGYFGDMTRTVVRGRASDKVKRMFDAVIEGQEIAFKAIKAGASGLKIHTAITKRFDELGFPTGEIDGRMQGFFHGTGHAVGLEIHEPPRIGKMRATLRAGMVMTVEPGLYYEDAGGIRLEDIVVVTKSGCKNLNRYPKVLEAN